jgi:hypothetical protein
MFVGAIVIGGDGACAIVHPLTHGGIAQVGQMIGLCALGQCGVFNLDEIADMHFLAQLRTGAQACKRPDQCAAADLDAYFAATGF